MVVFNKVFYIFLSYIVCIGFVNSVAQAEMQVQSLNMNSGYSYSSQQSHSYSNNSSYQNTNSYSSSSRNNSLSGYGVIDIPVNAPTSYSYKTRDFVYGMRKGYVQKSIFADANYEPSEEVFGQIEDNYPWISISGELYGAPTPVSGPSEEARFINNPSILVALRDNGCSYNPNKLSQIASNPDVLLIPRKIQYDKQKKEITVTYNTSSIPSEDFRFAGYSFIGINARDFGYKYAYLDRGRSSLQMEFEDSNNISNSIIEFQDFLHRGGSCGVSGGCNNGSPNQPYLHFVAKNKGTIYIKLWKNRPDSPYTSADIIQKIVLQ